MLPLAANPGETFIDLLDPLANDAPIGFELGFARATQADAAFLALEVSPAAD